MDQKIRYTFSPPKKSLPIYIDSIGYNPFELDFNRPEGFPYYHWLQTVKGEGVIEIMGQKFSLEKGHGILLAPYTPHRYQPNYKKTTDWSTVYLTFSGDAIESIFNALEINYSIVYHEIGGEYLSNYLQEIFTYLESAQIAESTIYYDLSMKLYNFILLLKQHVEVDDRLPRIHSYDKIKPIVEWLEQVYPENIGLLEISEQANLSSQHLNKLFHEAFNMSPYAFLVQLRIREAKRLLLTDVDLTLKEIASRVGFNAVSHFVTTFKSREGMTPNQYRELNVNQGIQRNL